MFELNFKDAGAADQQQVIIIGGLADLAKELGAKATLYPSIDGNGLKVVVKKPDGSYAILPCSKKMTPEAFPRAVVCNVKDEAGNIVVDETTQKPMLIVARNPVDGGRALATIG